MKLNPRAAKIKFDKDDVGTNDAIDSLGRIPKWHLLKRRVRAWINVNIKNKNGKLLIGSRDAAIKVEKKREGTYGGFTVGKFSERGFTKTQGDKYKENNSDKFESDRYKYARKSITSCSSMFMSLFVMSLAFSDAALYWFK